MEATTGAVKKRRCEADLVVVEGSGAMVQPALDARRTLGPRISNERGRMSSTRDCRHHSACRCFSNVWVLVPEGLRDLGPWPATVLTDHHVAPAGCPLGGRRGAARRDHHKGSEGGRGCLVTTRQPRPRVFGGWSAGGRVYVSGPPGLVLRAGRRADGGTPRAWWARKAHRG